MWNLLFALGFGSFMLSIVPTFGLFSAGVLEKPTTNRWFLAVVFCYLVSAICLVLIQGVTR